MTFLTFPMFHSHCFILENFLSDLEYPHEVEACLEMNGLFTLKLGRTAGADTPGMCECRSVS